MFSSSSSATETYKIYFLDFFILQVEIWKRGWLIDFCKHFFFPNSFVLWLSSKYFSNNGIFLFFSISISLVPVSLRFKWSVPRFSLSMVDIGFELFSQNCDPAVNIYELFPNLWPKLILDWVLLFSKVDIPKIQSNNKLPFL